MDKLKKAAVAVLIICTLLTLALIFGNSSESMVESSAKSESLLAFLTETLGLDFLAHNTLRKIAHVAEFTLLGFLVQEIFLLTLKKNIRGYSSVFTALFGLITALSDETVQIYTNRGSQVTDVWLDFSGVLFGTAIGLCLYLAVKHYCKNRGDKIFNGKE